MKKIFIFILLCFIGLVIAITSNQDVNPSSLLIYHDTVRLQPGLILADKSVRGEFIATENNLAIVRVRLRSFNRMNTTHLTFRLRQKGDSGWSVSSTYALDRVPDGLLYPFGFPPIPGSKGNVYEFELASTDGTPDNAVGVSGGYHGVAAQYVQPLPEFIPEKIISTVRDPYSIIYLSMFFVPACIFLFNKYRLPLFSYMLIAYAYLPVSVHSNAIFFIAATELFAGNAFLIGILLLVQIPVTIAFGNIFAANRLATLVFFSVVVGAIIALRELKRKQHV